MTRALCVDFDSVDSAVAWMVDCGRVSGAWRIRLWGDVGGIGCVDTSSLHARLAFLAEPFSERIFFNVLDAAVAFGLFWVIAS